MCMIRQNPTSQMIRLETKIQYLFKYSTFPTDLLKVQKNNVNKNSILLICNIDPVCHVTVLVLNKKC
jgi:hypothetical protein